MVWRATDPPGNESGKIMFELPQYTRGAGLTWGVGLTRLGRTSSA
jgi:hypothetical protein